MPQQQNVDALKRAAEKFKARDLEGYLQLYTTSVLHHGFSNRIKPGVSGLRDHFATLLKAFPDMRIDIEDVIAQGEKVVERFTFYGTHRDEFMGVPPTMKLVSAPGVQISLFSQGKCIEVWHVLDTLKFLSQAGVVAPIGQRR